MSDKALYVAYTPSKQSPSLVITPERDLPRAAGRRADGEHTLFNGDIECRLFTWRPHQWPGASERDA